MIYHSVETKIFDGVVNLFCFAATALRFLCCFVTVGNVGIFINFVAVVIIIVELGPFVVFIVDFFSIVKNFFYAL